MTPDWSAGHCQGVSDDTADGFFPDTGTSAIANALCPTCPLRVECRDYARSEGIPHGVWGGEGARSRTLWWRDNGGRPSAFLDVTQSYFGVMESREGQYRRWAREAQHREELAG